MQIKITEHIIINLLHECFDSIRGRYLIIKLLLSKLIIISYRKAYYRLTELIIIYIYKHFSNSDILVLNAIVSHSWLTNLQVITIPVNEDII